MPRLALVLAALALGTLAALAPAHVALVAVSALAVLAGAPARSLDESTVVFVRVEPGGMSVTTLGTGAPQDGRELADRIAAIVGRR